MNVQSTNTKELLNKTKLVFLAEYIEAVPSHFVNIRVAKQSHPFIPALKE